MIKYLLTILTLLFAAGCYEASSEHHVVQVENQAHVAELKYKVTGMHCDACANAIQAKLVKVQGVIDANVSFEGSSAIVKTHDPSIAPTVLAAIKDMQFEAEPVDQLPVSAAETAAN